MSDLLVYGVQDGEWVHGRPKPLGAISEACISPAWGSGHPYGNSLQISKSGLVVVWAPWVGGGLDERMNEAASTFELMETDELAQSEPDVRALGLRLARCTVFPNAECSPR